MQGVSSVWGHALFCPANIIFWRMRDMICKKCGAILEPKKEIKEAKKATKKKTKKESAEKSAEAK